MASSSPLRTNGSLLEVDRHDFARGFERQVHLLVRQQVAHRGDAVGEPLRTDDAPVDVERALSAGRDWRVRFLRRGGTFVAQQVIEAQCQAEYHENNGGDDPFLFLIHCESQVLRWESYAKIRKRRMDAKLNCARFGGTFRRIKVSF